MSRNALCCQNFPKLIKVVSFRLWIISSWLIISISTVKTKSCMYVWAILSLNDLDSLKSETGTMSDKRITDIPIKTPEADFVITIATEFHPLLVHLPWTMIKRFPNYSSGLNRGVFTIAYTPHQTSDCDRISTWYAVFYHPTVKFYFQPWQ